MTLLIITLAIVLLSLAIITARAIAYAHSDDYKIITRLNEMTK